MNLLIVIPVFNSWEALLPLIQSLKEIPADICIVNDGSDFIPDWAAFHPSAALLHHGANKGKGAALRTGFSYALEQGYEAVITMDSDGQHEPRFFPSFTEALRKHPFVIGKRDFENPSMPLLRRFSNRMTSRILSWLLRVSIEDAQCGYRALRREVLEVVETTAPGFDMESEYIIRAVRKGFAPHFIPISTVYNGSVSAIKGIRDTRSFICLCFRALFKGL